MKTPFITKEKAEEIIKQYPTPFHIYDEKGIRQRARDLYKAFSWNKGFKEYFAVKATPNPFILKILKEEGCGVDCSSLTELMMSDCCGFSGSDIMFSSNVTPKADFLKARELGAYINLDDFTHIDYLDDLCGIPETICCRFNPGGHFEIETQIMDNPGEAKYGFTRDQLFEGFKVLQQKGAKHFGLHAFLASNTVSNAYYPKLARILFELAVELVALAPGTFSSSATASLRLTPPPPMAITVVPIVPIPSNAAIQPAASHLFQFFIFLPFPILLSMFIFA